MPSSENKSGDELSKMNPGASDDVFLYYGESMKGTFHLWDHLQTSPPWAGDSVPATLEELKAVKRHLLKDHFGQIEKAFLRKALELSKGNISQAAARVGMQRPNFRTLMKKHRISSKAPEEPS